MAFTTQVGLSELSVTEFLTLGRMGFFPVGVVVGVSVYDAGISNAFNSPWTGTRELVAVGDAMRKARHLALERLRAQAEQYGADGVVDVKLDVEHHVWRGGHTVARFEAVGTAVRYMPDRVPQLGRAPSLHVGKRPFTSDLKATEFATLLQSGYRPVALAMGNCVIQVARMLVMGFSNYEIDSYTKAFMDAREEAMLRLEQDLFKEFPKGSPDAPAGVVGMDVQEHAHANEGVVEYSAVGTAIAPLPQPNPWQTKTLVAPIMVVPLDR